MGTISVGTIVEVVVLVSLLGAFVAGFLFCDGGLVDMAGRHREEREKASAGMHRVECLMKAYAEVARSAGESQCLARIPWEVMIPEVRDVLTGLGMKISDVQGFCLVTWGEEDTQSLKRENLRLMDECIRLRYNLYRRADLYFLDESALWVGIGNYEKSRKCDRLAYGYWSRACWIEKQHGEALNGR